MQDTSFELQRLLGRTARSDRAAFKQLYDQTAAKLFGVALRITGRRDIAEDALQECFIAIWQRAADYDSVRGGAMGWMTTILRHTAIDRLRRPGSRPEGHLASAQLLTIAADARADSGAELRGLRRCLDELEERPRQAVLLAYHVRHDATGAGGPSGDAGRDHQELGSPRSRTPEAMSGR